MRKYTDLPRLSSLRPSEDLRGFGITMVVLPAYAINKGRAAIDGRRSFLQKKRKSSIYCHLIHYIQLLQLAQDLPKRYLTALDLK
jgi:hypothetical protein